MTCSSCSALVASASADTGFAVDVVWEVAHAAHGLEALAQAMRYILEVNSMSNLRSYRDFWNAISDPKPRTPS